MTHQPTFEVCGTETQAEPHATETRAAGRAAGSGAESRTPETHAEFRPADPAPTACEAELLLFALDRSRTLIAWKCGGLDAAALNRPQPPSTMTLGRILKHLAVVEARYTIDFEGRAPGAPLDTPEAQSDPDWAWRTADDDTPEHLHALWYNAAQRSRTALAEALADGGLDQPAKFSTGDDGTHPNLRRIVVDLADEYARHVGHVDLFREAVDGLVGEAPPGDA